MDNRMSLESFLADIEVQASSERGINKISELAGRARYIGEKVTSWLQSNNVVGAAEQISGKQAIYPVVESFNPAMSLKTIGAEQLNTLVKECGIGTEDVGCAAIQLAITMSKFAPGFRSKSMMWQQHNLATESFNNNLHLTSLDTIYSPEMMATVSSDADNKATLEAFGVDMDVTVPDLKTAMVITLLKYHAAITPRLLPTMPTTQPTILYTKTRGEVADMNDPSQVKRITDLYENPEFVNNELQKIIPLVANDSTNKYLVSDGIIKPNVTANILELSINSSEGYAKINRTDLVADSVLLNSVLFSLSATVGGTPTTEIFELAIPATIARLTRPTNAMSANDRTADISYSAFFTKNMKTQAGATSTILAQMSDTDEGYLVSLIVRPSINLLRGTVNSLIGVTIAAHHKLDATGAAIDATAAALIAATTSAATGYTLDARFSEENLRKTNIEVRTEAQPFSYNFPVSRTYVYRYSLQQDPKDTASSLTKIIRIGQDSKNLTVITGTLNHVYDMLAAAAVTNPINTRPVGDYYVAGDMVRPYVFSGTFNINTLTKMRDADRSGDIKQHFITYLQGVLETLMHKSFLRQELASGQPARFKMVTSGPILGNIIGQPHIHQHLETGVRGDMDGAEYKFVLPDGTVVEVITTTFSAYNTKMVIIPFVEGAPDSILNFGQVWTYGTLVGQYTQGNDGVHQRMIANTRELLIPTNPVGAIIDVSGMDSVSFQA